MTRYIVRRMLFTIPVLFVATVVVFGMVHALPGDVALRIAGMEATASNVESIRHQLGLDQPLTVQYSRFMIRMLRGDLGRSLVSQVPVAQMIAIHLGPTVRLASLSLTIALPAGLALGTMSALKHNTVWDMLTTAVSVIGISMPIYWLGLILIWIFAVWLGWFPTSGNNNGFRSLVLPALTLSAVTMPIIARMTRSGVLETFRQDYVRTARSKGLSGRTIVIRHVLRNAAIPIVTVIGLQIGYLFGGSVLTETVFGWPGMGRMVVQAIMNRDMPVVQGSVLLIAVFFIFVNLIVDLTYVYSDPRTRYA